jgi:hypothetical protein
MAYNDDLREFFFSAPPDKQAYETLELRHAAFASPARVVNDRNDLIATLESDAPANPSTAVTFSKCRFRFVLPESSDGMPQCQIEMQNVSRILMPYLEQAVSQATTLDLSFRLFYSDDLSAPGYVIHGLTLKRVKASILKVSGPAGFEDFLSRPFPRRVYTIKEFPGLAR